MTIKRFSLRFNLDNEADRRAWEHLQPVTDSKNKTIISAILIRISPTPPPKINELASVAATNGAKNGKKRKKPDKTKRNATNRPKFTPESAKSSKKIRRAFDSPSPF